MSENAEFFQDSAVEIGHLAAEIPSCSTRHQSHLDQVPPLQREKPPEEQESCGQSINAYLDWEMTHDPQDLEWERRYAERDTPWDKGAAAPALVKYLREGQISGRVLVPGCGTGHDVRALGALPETSVVGLDISPTAIARAKELTPADSTVSFVEGDFFALPAKLNRSFDWLVEHTCFCAIEPSQRPAYVLSASHALRTGGKIFGIFYLNPDTDSGPPFAVSVETLSGLFEPQFHLREKWVPKESFPGREGRELIWMMEKR